MSANDFIWGGYPIPGADWPVKNTSGSAMTAQAVVKLDTAAPISASQSCAGVALTSAVTDVPFGVLIENIPVGQVGRCRVEGGVVCVASAAISVGATVGASGATAGQIATYTNGDPSLGQAMTAAAAANDQVLVRLNGSKNA